LLLPEYYYNFCPLYTLNTVKSISINEFSDILDILETFTL
jgi:hypothetical protein